MADSQKRTKEISDGIAPFLREEVKHTRELIRTELTADQSRKYDEMVRPNKQKKKKRCRSKVSPAKWPSKKLTVDSGRWAVAMSGFVFSPFSRFFHFPALIPVPNLPRHDFTDIQDCCFGG